MTLELIKMSQRATHNRTFRLAYINSPQRSNIFAGVHVSVHTTTTIFAFKRLTVSVADVITNRACFTCVSGVNYNNGDSFKPRLVFDKKSKLPKIPPTHTNTKPLASWLPSCSSNMSQVFQRNSFATFKCSMYNRFRNSVVLNCRRSFFASAEPFQQSFRTACAFALNRTTNPLFLFSILFKPFRRMFFTIGRNNYISYTKIATYKFFSSSYALFRYVTSLKKKEFTLPVHQTSLTADIREMIKVMTNERNLLSSFYRPYGRNHTRFICENPGIVRDSSSVPKMSNNLLAAFVGIGNFTDTTNNHLAAQVERIFYIIVALMMQLDLVKHSFFPGNFRNIVAAGIRFFDGRKQEFGLVKIGEELDFQHQYHNTIYLK